MDKVEKVDRQSLNVPKEWKLLPDNRTEAKKVNSIHFFTGRVCESGHLDLRLTSNNSCMECVRERSKGYYYKYHEEKKAKARERAKKRFESGAYQKYLETGNTQVLLPYAQSVQNLNVPVNKLEQYNEERDNTIPELQNLEDIESVFNDKG